MRGDRDLQFARFITSRLEMRSDQGDIARPAGDDDTFGAVDHANGHIRVISQQRRDLGCGGEHGDHAAHGPRHELAAGNHQPQPIFQGEDACGVGRGKIAQAVPEHQRWLDAPRTPQIGQRAFQRKVHRLATGMRLHQIVMRRWCGGIEQLDERAP